MNQPNFPPAHSLDPAEICRRLEVDLATGLSATEANRRLEVHGSNELDQKAGTPAWVLFLHQFKSPLIYVLLAAAVVAAALGEFKDAGVILGVLLINAVIGFIQEGRAERSMATLKKLTSPQAHVRREGRPVTIPGREVVPGDILILAAGDRVANPAPAALDTRDDDRPGNVATFTPD